MQLLYCCNAWVLEDESPPAARLQRARRAASSGSRRTGSWSMARPRTKTFTFLFITNKEFGIHFIGDENDPTAPTAAR
jgi:hypothetical protein